MTPHNPSGDHPAEPPGFFDPGRFASSPLYTALCPVVLADRSLRELALRGRPGQRPEFLLFGAVHQLLLDGVDHELARFYPSVVGDDDAANPDQAGPALTAFCRQFHDEVAGIVGTRLVQTNHVRRAVALRAALAYLAPVLDRPVDVVEVGASAGLLLNFMRYGYRLRRPSDGAELRFGDLASPVQLDCDLLGTRPPPDLDVLPAIGSVLGVDLHPIDPAAPGERAWLEALVWPEDHLQRALLGAALDLAGQVPSTIVAGDAVDVLPRLAGHSDRQHARLVFHCATRIHVPPQRRAAFDESIRALGQDAPMWEVAVEDPPEPDPRTSAPRQPAVGLVVTDPDGRSSTIAVAEGHLRWLEFSAPRVVAGGPASGRSRGRARLEDSPWSS